MAKQLSSNEQPETIYTELEANTLFYTELEANTLLYTELEANTLLYKIPRQCVYYPL